MEIPFLQMSFDKIQIKAKCGFQARKAIIVSIRLLYHYISYYGSKLHDSPLRNGFLTASAGSLAGLIFSAVAFLPPSYIWSLSEEFY